MSDRPTPQGWSPAIKFFHWSIVVLLLVQGIFALVMESLPRHMRADSMMFHKSMGILILVLALARLATRLFTQAPPALPEVSALNQKLAGLGHALLYLLLFATPLSGFLMSAFAGRELPFFGLFTVPAPVAQNEHLAALMKQAHEPLFFALVLVAFGHAAMALYHHFAKRDATLKRMLPNHGRNNG